MQPDKIAVTITRQGAQVIARTSGRLDRLDARGAVLEQEYGYSGITAALRRRDLTCTVEPGLSDYIIRADLPDGSVLTISPPQEPPGDHPPGYPKSWVVTRSHPYVGTVHQVLYNSEPGGPDAHNAGDTAALLSAVNARLDQLGVPAPGGPSEPEPFNAADAVLHRAGFVSEVTHRGRVHRLPAAMNDPAEQRRTVTRAVDMLRAGNTTYACDADLLDDNPPVRADREVGLGERLSDLAQEIIGAGHTSQVVAALSEVTAPGTGVLDRLTDVLTATADWWAGLGAPADPLYADRLRRVTAHVGVSIQEIQTLRDTLADRHTTHPRAARSDLASHEPRAAALARSPAAATQARPVPTPTTPARTTGPQPKRRPSTPGR